MDQKQIEEIVRSVMASMGQAAPAPSEAKCATTTCAAPVTSESCALDLGSAEAKAWIGVENPHHADVLTELRRSTVARVCTGRAGPRPRTQALLRFLADHSRSKDTVLKEVPEEWVKAQGLLDEAAHEKRESVSNKIRKLKTFALQLRQLFYVCQFRLHLYVLKIFTSSRI